ncbi:extracellular matrix/biofilm biosynthesis regulator RemA family protein [Natribacillus halophilus]|uniref:Regulatory protein n=1 Tax=Natribacillus halophilus TaxID=549003 RepID=A0A1G8NTV8_9BACI|nr:extracellular matrix/biofilm biosynthesis regulator RemA family protein [Natribacillus halophilus]SDI83613.1 hypothetical protein SAMN04488123_10727 [Natribacillus halophilus]
MKPYLNIGYGNTVMTDRILRMEETTDASVRRIMRKEQDENRLVDGTAGNKTHTLIFMDSGHVVASAMRKNRLIRRLNGKRPDPAGEAKKNQD